MPTPPPLALPSEQKLLRGLGERLRLARQRRKFSMALVAERAGLSRVTLHRIEKGNAAVTLGSYLRVMFVLRLDRDLDLIAKDDELGRRLRDLELPQSRARAKP